MSTASPATATNRPTAPEAIIGALPAVRRLGSLLAASRRTHIYPVGKRYEGSVFAWVGDACVEQLATSDFGDTIPFLSTGPEIPANEFARVRLVRPSGS